MNVGTFTDLSLSMSTVMSNWLYVNSELRLYCSSFCRKKKSFGFFMKSNLND